MRYLIALLLLYSVSVSAQTQAVNLKPGSTTHAVVTVCANAIGCSGVPVGYFAATVNTSNASSWRMVYNAGTATALFQSTGYTYTAYLLHIGTSQADCVAFAAANSITIPAAMLSP
jgi:hypothetical protein